MKLKLAIGVLLVIAAAAGFLVHKGIIPADSVKQQLTQITAPITGDTAAAAPDKSTMSPADLAAGETEKEKATALAVTIAAAVPHEFVERVLVTGSLVPREEIMVHPEVDGLRIVDIQAEVGDRVDKGAILARLERESLESQLDQNTASLARADAAIAQARSAITEAEARLEEAEAAFKRSKPLKSSGYLSESLFDQRRAAATSAKARLVSARDGLTVAEADKARIQAERRGLTWRIARTDIKAPASGLVSRRTARLGAITTGMSDALFRIIEDAQVELDAEIEDQLIGQLEVGQQAIVDVAGVGQTTGKVRLIPPEIDQSTRLGSARILLGDDPRLRIGAFAKGRIETARGRGLAIPAAAVLYGPEGPTVQRVVDSRVRTVPIETGLRSGGLVEVRKGLAAGDRVIAKAGTFLRDGDAVRPMQPNPVVSQAPAKTPFNPRQ